uniref:Uncharacterized protein n=1 Tax=Leersia perrieri TaxID=77586 RepID=A0A0D9WFB4_9ORYZ
MGLHGIRATDPWEFEHRQGVGEQFEHRQGVGEASGAVRIYLVVFTEEVRTTCSVKCQTGGQGMRGIFFPVFWAPHQAAGSVHGDSQFHNM